MKFTINVRHMPVDRSMNFLYYLLEADLIIETNEGSLILSEEMISIVEMSSLLRDWEGTRFFGEFDYSPDSYQYNPMFRVVPTGDDYEVLGTDHGFATRHRIPRKEVHNFVRAFTTEVNRVIQSS